MKKKIALLLAALMIFGAAIPMHVFAAAATAEVTWEYTHTGEDARYAVENDQLADLANVYENGQPSHLRLTATKALTTTDLRKGVNFDLVLTNGEWAYANTSVYAYDRYDGTGPSDWYHAKNDPIYEALLPNYLLYAEQAMASAYYEGNDTFVRHGAADENNEIAYTLQISNKDASRVHVVIYGQEDGESVIPGNRDIADFISESVLVDALGHLLYPLTDDFILVDDDGDVVANLQGMHVLMPAYTYNKKTDTYSFDTSKTKAVQFTGDLTGDDAGVWGESADELAYAAWFELATAATAVDAADRSATEKAYAAFDAAHPALVDPTAAVDVSVTVNKSEASKSFSADPLNIEDGVGVPEGAVLEIPLIFFNTSDTASTTVSMDTTTVWGTYFGNPKNKVVVDVPGEATVKFDSVISSKEVFDLDTFIVTEKKPDTFNTSGDLYLFAPEGFIWATPKDKVLEFSAENLGVREIGDCDWEILDYPVWTKFDDVSKTVAYDADQAIRLHYDFTRNGLNERGVAIHTVKLYVDGLRLVALDNAPFGENFKVRVGENTKNAITAMYDSRDQKTADKLALERPLLIGDWRDVDAFTRVDWGIDFSLKKGETVAEIWAGRKDQEMPIAVFKELAPVSWWAENVTDFTLVDAEGKSLANKVKLQSVTIDDNDNIPYLDPVEDVLKPVTTNTGVVRVYYDKFSIYNTPITDSEHKKGSVTFYCEISASANYAGPVYLKATGRGIPTGTDVPALLIANVKAPLEIQTKTTYVQVGYQTVPVADVRVIEAAKDLYEKSYDLEVGIQVFDNMNEIVDVAFIDASKIKLTMNSGNGLLGTPDIQGSTIIVPVTRNSTSAPIDFTLSGLKIYINRAIPEGHYDVVVGGRAVVDNWYEKANGVNLSNTNIAHAGLFNVFGVTSYDYIEVATQGLNKALSKNVVVTTDTPNVAIVDGVSTELAAPVYIDVVTGRTMVPINFISQSLGIEAKNVIWDATERKVIVVTAERTVEFFIDTNKFTINGAAKYMVENGVQVKSVINVANDRSYIPFTYLAQAFGITVAWDSAKHLAIYNPTLDQKTNGAVVIDSIPTFTTAQ